MMTTTDALIRDLAAKATPVRPLARPEVRALVWLGFGVAVVVVVMAIHGIDPQEVQRVLLDPRMLGEEAATIATAVSAAIAAFRSTVPGAGRRWFAVPFVALAAWVLLAGSGCAADYARIGTAALGLRLDTDCFLPAAIAGAVLTVAVIAMLRRGAPLVPRLTLVYAGMAVAATVNLGLLVLHEGDVSMMLLVWHTAYIAGLAAIGAWGAPALFGWSARAGPA
jgi:hypothetical protein